MQTILGSSGQIGQELAKALHKDFTTDIRLVSRNPKKVNANDQLFPANLLDAAQTDRAVAGSEIVYFTAGLTDEFRHVGSTISHYDDQRD